MRRYAQAVWRMCGCVGFWFMWPLIYVFIGRSQRARVCIRCGDEVLLVRPWLSSGAWQLPGGGLMRAESALDAAVREVREETGITLSKSQLKQSKEPIPVREVGIPFRAHIFQVILSKKPRVKKAPIEIADIAWISLDQLDGMKVSPSTKQARALIEIAD